MRIAISALQVSEKNSGIGKYIANLAGALMALYPEEYLIYHSRGVDPQKWAAGINVTLREIDAAKENYLGRNLFELFFFGRDIKRFSPAVYFAPDTKLPWGLSPRTKKIVTVHDLAIFKYPETYQRSRVLYWQKLFSSSVRRADQVIAISQATKRDVQEILGTPEKKIRVIYNGVGNEFKPLKDDDRCRELRIRYRLPEKFILFVGIFSPRKNLGRLIEAFAGLRRQGLPHQLVIAGETGWKFRQDLELVCKLNLESEIIFPGYLAEEDLPYIYSMADVLAYPSLYEGFGLPPLEAMACGTPVVASNTSSLPEVVGDAGVLADPYSVNDIARALESAVTDRLLRESLIQKGFQRAKEFSWEKAAHELHMLMIE